MLCYENFGIYVEIVLKLGGKFVVVVLFEDCCYVLYFFVDCVYEVDVIGLLF